MPFFSLLFFLWKFMEMTHLSLHNVPAEPIQPELPMERKEVGRARGQKQNPKRKKIWAPELANANFKRFCETNELINQLMDRTNYHADLNKQKG